MSNKLNCMGAAHSIHAQRLSLARGQSLTDWVFLRGEPKGKHQPPAFWQSGVEIITKIDGIF
jgi:sarcosine oxidase delta subunit